MELGQRSWVAAYRVFFAGLTLVAIVYQMIFSNHEFEQFRISNFFSFFTIESNIIALVVLALFGLRRSTSATQSLELLRGAAVLYMATTGVVYGLLLSGYTEGLDTTLPWVNNVVHRIMPLVLVADWLINPPAVRVAFRTALVWLIFPIVFLVYSLIRGPIVDWYPYPFLNPDDVGGYGGVALYCVGIAVFIVAMTWLVVWVGDHLRLAGRPNRV